MADQGPIENAQRLIDQLYAHEQSLPRDRIVEAASRAEIAPDVMTYFNHLPDGQYTRDQLVNQIDTMIRERGRERAVGLLR